MGRKELTAWVQQNFLPSFQKVEDCATGVVYNLIVDSIYPGAVNMSKLKRDAKTEVDSIHNFKVLQTAFSKKKIDRYIDVDKLTKRSFQHNMEFLQFMKCYWDMHAPNGAGPAEGAFADSAVENNPPSVEKPPVRVAKPAAEDTKALTRWGVQKMFDGGSVRPPSPPRPVSHFSAC